MRANTSDTALTATSLPIYLEGVLIGVWVGREKEQTATEGTIAASQCQSFPTACFHLCRSPYSPSRVWNVYSILFPAALRYTDAPILNQSTDTECIRHWSKCARNQRKSSTGVPPSCWHERAPFFLLFRHIFTCGFIVIVLYQVGSVGNGIVKARVVHDVSVGSVNL